VKKINCSFYKLLLPALLFSVTVNAQKLPGIQKASLRLPGNVKIDGKATEWNGKLQAYNHAIQASYTIANNNNKLYLIVQANRKEIINKIINGGVSFTVNKNRKSENSGITVTYPAYNSQERPIINLNTLFDVAPDATMKADSLVKNANSTLNDKTKFIGLSGMQDLDTLISVYNKDGIKAANLFNNNKTYTLEMAVDLKLFGLSAGDKNSFFYQIRLNQIEIDYVPGIIITRKEDGTISLMNVTDSKLANSFISALSTTDCWGEYTLAK
jgi:hypothetical protein